MAASTALGAATLENDGLRFDLRAPSSSDTACGMDGRDVVIFDLGGVLIEWNPRHLYRKLFDGDEVAMEHFLATVCTQEWNRGQDAGRLVADAARLLKQQHADNAELIDAFYGRFDEMMAGPISGTVDILAEEGYEYVCDWVLDDQPVVLKTRTSPLISVPYTQECNDVAMMLIQHHKASEYKDRAIDQFEQLYSDAQDSARIMALVFHPYLMGAPHRLRYFKEALEHIHSRSGVVFWTGEQILDWYLAQAKSVSVAR